MRLYKNDKSSDMNGQRWLVVLVTHISSGHETLQRHILVVMMKGVLKENSKHLDVNTHVCKFVDLGSEGFYLEIRSIQISLFWETSRFNLI